jgi:hypothetical protein
LAAALSFHAEVIEALSERRPLIDTRYLQLIGPPAATKIQHQNWTRGSAAAI